MLGSLVQIPVGPEWNLWGFSPEIWPPPTIKDLLLSVSVGMNEVCAPLYKACKIMGEWVDALLAVQGTAAPPGWLC